MCGITGFFEPGGQFSAEAAPGYLQAMTGAIAHRGPDDEGFWWDAECGIALGHRRLAILDLSPAGHQPMASRAGRYVLVYNGEVYNHLELRAALGGDWRGGSDTETLLAGFECWGVEATLRRMVGMFALAVWDRSTRELLLARDRFGEKPLYYGWQGGTLLFASELHAIRRHPHFSARIHPDAVSQLLRYGTVPAPLSIWQDIHKLPPGHWVRFGAQAQAATPTAFWSLGAVMVQAQDAPAAGSDADPAGMLDQLQMLLLRSVRQQMLADVPLGALLSGGVDSSLIVALAQAQSTRPMRTFTIGFGEAGFDESPHARAVARHLGTEHTELQVTAADALALIPRLSQIYDEPFADSSQLPTCLVMQLARQHVTVALSGDGGDELFGGYNRYTLAMVAWQRAAWLPLPLRRSLGRLLCGIAPQTLDRLSGVFPGLPPQLGLKLHKLGGRLQHCRSVDDFYAALLVEWAVPPSAVPSRWQSVLDQPGQWPALQDPVSRMMCMDALTYMPDDILVKVDRAAMAVSLETRAPFLDHRLAEFAATMPRSLKIRGGVGKWPLRQILYRYVPPSLIERPKQGFAIPLDRWLRHELREWASDLLNPATLQRQGHLAPGVIQQVWQEHLSGQRDHGAKLWSVLMFQNWLQQTAQGA